MIITFSLQLYEIYLNRMWNGFKAFDIYAWIVFELYYDLD